MKGLEPSTFAMARRRSSQLSYIRRGPSIAQAVMARSRRPARAGAPTEVPHARHRRHPRPARTRSRRARRRRSRGAHAHHRRAARARRTHQRRRHRRRHRARRPTAFETWRDVPAPRRGELVRLLGEELRREKEALGALVTLETGKIAQEGLGEVQEMIDICDLAVGLSRQLFGRTIASERPGHRMLETWHPLGPIGVDHAPSTSRSRCGAGTPRSRSCAAIRWCGSRASARRSRRSPASRSSERAAAAFGDAPDGLLEVVIGGADRARQLAEDPRLPLVSATGSTAMGKALSPLIAARLGRSLLELGGNNGMVVAPERRPRPGGARRRLQRRRHRRPALHEPAPPDRAREHRRRAVRPARARLRERAGRRSARGRHALRPAHLGGLLPAASRRRSSARAATAAASAAASACWPTSTPTPTTSAPRSCACRRRPTSCARRRSRRSSTR